MEEELTTNQEDSQEVEERINVEKTYTDPVTGKFVKDNPGKPRGAYSLTPILRRRLQEIKIQGRETAEQLVDNTIQDGLDLDGPSRKLVWEMMDGKARQPIDGGLDEDGRPISILGNIREQLDAIQQNNSNPQDSPTE